MAQHISGAVNHDIGAKRLRLIGQAKRDAEDQTSGGCTNDNAEESMALFNAECAAVAGVAEIKPVDPGHPAIDNGKVMKSAL